MPYHFEYINGGKRTCLSITTRVWVCVVPFALDFHNENPSISVELNGSCVCVCSLLFYLIAVYSYSPRTSHSFALAFGCCRSSSFASAMLSIDVMWFDLIRCVVAWTNFATIPFTYLMWYVLNLVSTRLDPLPPPCHRRRCCHHQTFSPPHSCSLARSFISN